MIEIVNRETGELMDADSVPGLAEVAAWHDRQIADLQELVQDLVDEPESAGKGAGSRPVVWSRLTPHEKATTWRALAEWVGWLRGRYPLARQVPLCWWRHPELVEELTALWLAWRDAYVEKGAPLAAGADWHGRWLPELLRRIGAGGWNVACEGEHKPPVTSLYDARAVDDVDEFRDSTTAHNGATTEKERTVMNDLSMQAALDAGQAKTLGELPGSPVAHDGRYWVAVQDGWQQVESEETIAFLADAERRLQLADAAAGCDSES